MNDWVLDQAIDRVMTVTPIEELVRSVPECSECGKPLREFKGKLACFDVGCPRYGMEGK